MHRPLLSFLLVFFISLIACHKPVEDRGVSSNPSPSGNPFVAPEREYHWGLYWSQTSRGNEIHLNSPRLSDSVIRRGVAIGLAVYSDWDLFGIIPFDYYDTNKNDTIHLSYDVTPGQLRIIAKTPFAISYPSDVYIQYN